MVISYTVGSDGSVDDGAVKRAYVRNYAKLAYNSVDAWLQGVGAAAIDNLMEDAATAEISRAQVWSWVQSGRFNEARVREEIAQIDAAGAAKEVFADVALSVPLKEFLTSEAYGRL